MSTSYVQTVIFMVLVLVLVAASMIISRRNAFWGLLPRMRPRRMQTIERLPLAPGHTAILLLKDGKEHFILLSPNGALDLQDREISPAKSEPFTWDRKRDVSGKR